MHTGIEYTLKGQPAPRTLTYAEQGFHTGDGVTIRAATAQNHQLIDGILKSELAQRGKIKK